MTFVITQNCCNDAACVPVCPVNCIHPTPENREYSNAEMLYIDPATCIDCGACEDACPVDAIYSDIDLPIQLAVYKDINAAYFTDPAHAGYPRKPKLKPRRQWQAQSGEPLRVAIVGAGPSGFYAAEELLTQAGLPIQVDMIERLPVPGGLVRYGVAPDHGRTKRVENEFARTLHRDGFRLIANVEVGRDVTHAQLAERYHAVLYTVGAMSDRALGIAGEDLPGSHSATEFVAWYNGHPDFAGQTFNLDGERAVVIGNGNVALDVARILLTDSDELQKTDIADNALAQLAESAVKEVVVIGRRGAAEAAFSMPELLGLMNMDGVDILVSADELPPQTDSEPDQISKVALLHSLSQRSPTGKKRIVLRFLHSPLEILGDSVTEGVRLERNKLSEENGKVVPVPTGETEDLACRLLLRSVGYRGSPIPGLPYDDHKGIIPNSAGRVAEPGKNSTVQGVYVSGWIKRGPSGVIGTNKQCAHETVSALLDDLESGSLLTPTLDSDIVSLVKNPIGRDGWSAIDAHERAAGNTLSRPRIKLLDVDQMLRVADKHSDVHGPCW